MVNGLSEDMMPTSPVDYFHLFSHYPNENGVVREQQLTSRPTTEKDINDH